MTRTQTRTYGVVTPPHIQPLLDAALRAFAWLVSNVVALFGMIFNRPTRDWHTGAVHEDQLPATNDQQQGQHSGPPGPRPAVDAQRRERTLHDHAPAPILRDDRRYAPIPQDEAGGLKHEDKEALILRDLRTAQIVSKDGGGLTSLSTRITRHTHSSSSRKPRSRYPGPIRLQSNLQNGSRRALRLAGMTPTA